MLLISLFVLFTRRLRKRLSKSSAHLCVLKSLTIFSIISSEILVKKKIQRLAIVSLCLRRGGWGGLGVGKEISSARPTGVVWIMEV